MLSPRLWNNFKNNVSLRNMPALILFCIATLAQQPAFSAALACEVVLSRSQVEIGRVSPTEVNPRHLTQGQISLGKQMSTLNVVCPEPTRFAVIFRAAADSETSYRLGDSANATSLKITLAQGQADGKAATFGSTLDSARNGSRMILIPGDGAHLQILGQNLAVTRLTALVEIETFFDAARMKSPSDRDLNGGGFFEVIPF